MSYLTSVGILGGFYAAYKGGANEPGPYLGYGAAGYLVGFLADGYVAGKKAAYSGYGDYGLSCMAYRRGSADAQYQWLRTLAHREGCRPPYGKSWDNCATAALMRYDADYQADWDAEKEAKKAEAAARRASGPFSKLGIPYNPYEYSCPPPPTPTAKEIAQMKQNRRWGQVPEAGGRQLFTGAGSPKYLYNPLLIGAAIGAVMWGLSK